MLQVTPMARIGYARVSTLDQDHATQEARLRPAGCKIMRSEKASGKSRQGRDELASIVEFIRGGDELVVVKLDRLARSTRDVLNLVHELEAKSAALTVLEPAFSTKDQRGRFW
jgi:DNA invertase Pin-like site-specific DNA recombinase